MLKKLTLLAISVVAMVAFAVPAAAQANPIVENIFGEEAFEPTAVSHNPTWTVSPGVYQCSRSDLTLSGSEGHYTGTGTAEGSVYSGTETGPCVVSNGWHIIISPMTVSLDLNGGGTGTAAISYSYTYGPPGSTPYKCSYTGNNLSVTYAPGSSQVTIKGTLTGTGCHASAQFRADYTVIDEFGEVAKVN